ncbi:type II toxin-antitoxin system Phd/YefM family antitoxin [Pelotomaculum terephthalicicum JT]|nr:type II toxin-antitoxin system Phd/YefM family antitoxin [Pelotomaculum terephthalicicum]MCG9969910.1 type II toxin-antitoxin system Phd/YefM family antitoxin [Pelotomaculum terephthalicicum JT]
MNIKEDIRPISYVKANAAEILAQVNETHRPVYVNIRSFGRKPPSRI